MSFLINKLLIGTILLLFLLCPKINLAQIYDPKLDNDQDNLTNYEEQFIYFTHPEMFDTDGDGYNDGEEINNNYDPNLAGNDKITKIIGVNLKEQTLTYALGPYLIKTIKISSGIRRTPTPKGEFNVISKKPLVDYKGADYNYPKTKWNLLFKYSTPGSYYIHGAYWHNNFGRPMSHGCVNVPYSEMETLYNWVEDGVKIFIE